MALLTLALGIGLTTAVYTVVDQSILRPFGYPDIDRMVLLTERYESNPMSVSWPNFVDWKAQSTSFEELGVYRNAAVTLTGHGDPERLNGAVMSASVFDSAGIRPILGRRFADADDQPDAPRAVVVSERLWRSHFAGDASVLGQRLTLNGESYAVIGVMASAMRFPSRLTDVWFSLGPAVSTFPGSRDNHPGLTAIGRLKPGVALETAATEMEVIARRLEAAHPDTNGRTHVVLRAYRETIVENVRPAFRLLVGSVLLLLLMACANLASLMLARGDGRRQELAVRAALGASRGRLLSHLLTEAAILSLVGGLAGAGLAFGAVRLFVASRPTSIPRIDLVGVDVGVLLFAVAISLLTGLVFGAGPALRGSKAALQQAIRTGREGARRGQARRLLVVTEVAVAFLLLVGAGLFGRSLHSLLALDLGFASEHVTTMQVALPAASYQTVDRWLSFHRSLLDELTGTAGIEHVALTSNVPLSGNAGESGLMRDGDPMPTAEHPPAECSFSVASPTYFETMGIRLVRGRAFTSHDGASSQPVIIIDDEAAARLYPGSDPIGQRLSFESHGETLATFSPIWRVIVGVVHHVRQYGLTVEPPYVQVFTPIEQLPIWMTERRPVLSIVVRSAESPDGIVTSVRRAVRTLDPNLPVSGMSTLTTSIASATEQPRLSLVLVGAFAGIALVLAIVGVYGVLAQNVAQRTREIAVRMALGAKRGQVGALVARQAAVLVVAGLAIGGGAAYALGRFVQSMLYDVSPTDPLTIATMAAALAVTAAVAAAIPARRAATIDPLTALRTE